MGATVLTVPEPQQLSPLLQKISPPFTISSLSNIVRSPNSSPFLQPGGSRSPYNTPGTPLTPRTPVTPVSDTASSVKSEPSDSTGSKEKKPKRPKLSKQEREHNKLQREQKKRLTSAGGGDNKKEQHQWKMLQQQQRIFEEQRQAILSQSKAMAIDTMHPSQRFNATMNSSLAEDALQHSLMMKAKAEAAQIHSVGPPPPPPHSAHIHSSASQFSRSSNSSIVVTTTTSTMSSAGVSKLSSDAPQRPSSTEHFSQQQQEMMHQGSPLKGVPPHGIGNSNPTDHFNNSFLNEQQLDPMRMRSSEQHKAFLYQQQQQQQQYMASQQQYIQWQLAQQAAGNMYGHVGKQLPGKSNMDDKDMSSDSEEQKRMRLFNQQRQQQFSNKPSQHGGDKRPGDHPSHFMLPDGSPAPPNRAGSGFLPRGGGSGQFPGANSPEAALYQQMFMQYFMKYRKSQGIDPSQFPTHELYMMAEFAKQSFAREMQQYGKGYPPMSQPNHPSMQEPFGKQLPPGGMQSRPHNFPGPPQDQYDWTQRGPSTNSISHLDMLALQHSNNSDGGGGGGQTIVQKPHNNATNTTQQQRQYGKVNPTPLDDHKQQQQQQQLSNPANNMHPTGGSLPKSASFQISRIAADSTSNDDFPSNKKPGEFLEFLH